MASISSIKANFTLACKKALSASRINSLNISQRGDRVGPTVRSTGAMCGTPVAEAANPRRHEFVLVGREWTEICTRHTVSGDVRSEWDDKNSKLGVWAAMSIGKGFVRLVINLFKPSVSKWTRTCSMTRFNPSKEAAVGALRPCRSTKRSQSVG
jgi:hypothetical protein